MRDSMRIFGLLPFRGLDDPKTRLGSVLSVGERGNLALDLLRQAVDAMLAGGIERLAVITLDERLACAGLDPRAEVIVQRGRGLNHAVHEGQAWAMVGGADGLLTVLPDLPLVSADDVRALLDAATEEGAVIAPDRHGLGTNALLLAPPDAIPPSFGIDSAPRHRLALALADIPVTDIQRPGTHLDLDTPDDLEQLLGAECRVPSNSMSR
ncbi:MAG TPA: 2-phospho-L-lactate guanylyltransferase [Thermomicrobiales bacterium]|nr:2-phospho-L-lactate guanylyltransferase [Thermomicrobiales bacterium]